MKTIYSVGQTPMEIGAITPLVTQMLMQGMAEMAEKVVRERLTSEEQVGVIVQIRLKKRFFGADEVITNFQAPPDVLLKLKAAD